ncbi:MAG: hypothetical protein J5938_05650 [Clostridia bacterium]|nr:hypothetical protein [Clostridia bacterium]
MLARKIMYTEACYPAGILLLAFGTMMMQKADLGMSMVVAPAYLIFRKISGFLPWYTFGMSEFLFQAVILLLLGILVKRFRLSYLFSFLTAFLYGLTLDLFSLVFSFFEPSSLSFRIVCYSVGILVVALGVSFFFLSYFPPEAYELFVMVLSRRYRWKLSTVKTVYDAVSCLTGVILSFSFFGFGRFEGVKIGTLVSAVVTGPLIGLFGRMLEAGFSFTDLWGGRRFFDNLDGGSDLSP